MYNVQLEKDVQQTVMNKNDKKALVKILASRLARISPYLQLTDTYYSMAQDNCLMSDIAISKFKSKTLALTILFYKCGEAYVGSFDRYYRQVMISEFGYDPAQKLAKSQTEWLYEELNLPSVFLAETKEKISIIKKIATATVMRDFDLEMLPKPKVLDPFNKVIKSWAWPRAEEEFFKRYERLADAF